MEKLQLGRKRKTDAEKPRMDPLMRALKALHSAGSPEAMTPEELEHQRRNQEILGRLTAPMAGMEYEELSIGAMPAAWTRLKAPHGDRRVILYCHGGGYTSGNLGYSRVLSSKLAHVTGYDVLSFEYRLAPEHPYPAAVEDAMRAWDYLMYQGYGAENVTVAGDSAGGNLALVLCRRLKAAGRRIVAVYVGGGTPTTLTAPELDRLLTDTKACFDLSACREFTVEAGRPDTVTEEKLAVLVSHGVDRVSVNPQTMSDAVLETIGRHHTAAQVREAVAMVKKFPSLSFNMDLIAGLPGDTPESFAATVREVIALGAENVTVHTLALKKGSRFLTEGTLLPDGDAVGAMLSYAREALEAAGYAPYYLYRQKFMSGSFENVGWTKPGYRNLYNICIMEELCGILAVGAGGSTKLTAPGGIVKRIMAPKYPREYMERIAQTCAEKDEIVRFYNSEPKGTN